MATKRLANPSQLALGMCSSHNALCAQTRKTHILMVGDEEFVLGLVLEALLAAPGHVLDGQEGAVVEEDEVEFAMHDDGAVEIVDDAGDDFVGGLWGGVGVEDAVGAFGPGLDRGVDGFLHGGAVEVDLFACGQVVEGAGEAEHVPEERAGGGDLVDIEARICVEDGVVNVVPESAFTCVVRGLRELAWGWEGEVLLQVLGIATLASASANVLGEGLVEVEEARPALDEFDCGDVFKHGVFVDAGVIDHGALHIVELLVLLVQHGICNVGNVAAGIRFSRNVDLTVIKTKGVDEVLEEAQELFCNLFLVGSGWLSLSETRTDRLLDPDHVG